MAISTTYYGLFFIILDFRKKIVSPLPRSFQSQFAAYVKASVMFAAVVNQHYQEGDVVWCHDYHLMFLPKCLKEHNSDMKVACPVNM
ncbi:hypothetical protein CsSME_00048824 [Camellia sinensis var. sinensis]